MSLAWVAMFAPSARGNAADPAEQLTPLGNTRGQLIEQLARASALPQSPVVIAYIAEAKRRLRSLP